jgi:hypothetical protein
MTFNLKNYNFLFIEVRKVVIFREDKGTMTKKESKFYTISKYYLNNITTRECQISYKKFATN